MKLKLERSWLGQECTIGTLTVDGATECFTLEDVVREVPGLPVSEWKIKGETAIPKGVYNVVITPSQHFGRDLPLLEAVPGYEGVRIHPGNTAADTEGCILVGRTKSTRSVGESRAAFNDLFPKIQAALQGGGKVSIEIA